MKRKVYLEGELGEKYGKVREIYAPTIADIFKCLAANFPAFGKHLIELDKKGMDLKCLVNNEELDEATDLLLNKKGDVVVSIIPAGSKSAIKIIAGVGLIVFSGGLGAAMFGAGTFAATLAAGAFTALGVSLLTSGIQELLAPDPASNPNQIQKDAGYLYRGTSQRILDTDPVPVLYGRMRIPGRPISFEIRNKDSVITNF